MRYCMHTRVLETLKKCNFFTVSDKVSEVWKFFARVFYEFWPIYVKNKTKNKNKTKTKQKHNKNKTKTKQKQNKNKTKTKKKQKKNKKKTK